MLYDPKWEKTVKADPLSLPALIAWLEQQPANLRYCYTSVGHCLAAQYNASIGREYHTPMVFDQPEISDSFDLILEWIAIHASPMTFGGALKLARETFV